MLWLLALICRDFPCIICSKKSDLLLALKMLWWWFARNRQQARGTLPPCLHCQTATGKQPPRVGSPPGYRREWRIKKKSRWRVPGTGYASLCCQSRPNRGIPRGESGIGSPLPSIATTRVILDTTRGLEPC